MRFVFFFENGTVSCNYILQLTLSRNLTANMVNGKKQIDLCGNKNFEKEKKWLLRLFKNSSYLHLKFLNSKGNLVKIGEIFEEIKEALQSGIAPFTFHDIGLTSLNLLLNEPKQIPQQFHNDFNPKNSRIIISNAFLHNGSNNNSIIADVKLFCYM
jgi:hypothetical protein